MRRWCGLAGRSLRCESLEDRRLLAVMVATEAELRAAVLSPVGDPDVAMTADISIAGELRITETVNLDGGGFTLAQTMADARVINVDADPTTASPANSFAASISNLTVTGGYTSFGAGIRNNEDLTITGSVITGNRAVDPSMTYTGFGGGIATNGRLTLIDSYVTYNTAGSLIDLPTTGSSFYAKGLGGGIFSGAGSELTLSQVRVDNNDASNAGGGLAIQSVGPHAIDGSSFDNNTIGNSATHPITIGLDSAGGGVYADAGVSGMQLTITNSSASNNIFGSTAVPGNVAFDYGGGISMTLRGTSDLASLDNVTVSGNSSNSDGLSAGYLTVQRGGGIEMMAVEGGTFNVRDSVVSGNSLSPMGDFANYGGGLSFATFDNGAGVAYPGVFNVSRTTISDNFAGRGAAWGIRYNGGYNNDGIGARSHVNINRATVTGNTVEPSVGDGGGVHWAWLATDLSVENSQISDNYSPTGGGAFINLKAFNNSGLYSNADLTVRNSQITGNTSLTTGGAFDVSTSLLTYPAAVPNTVVVEFSEISGNVAFGNGGAFYAYDSNLTIFNSTVSGNSSFGVGGGLNALVACDVSGGGGPCYTGDVDNEAEFIIDRVTFANNYSGGNGTVNFGDNTGFDIDNTIIADSSVPDDLVGGGGAMTPNFQEVDHSLVEADASGNLVLAVGSGNITHMDPVLQGLADNGAVTSLPDGSNVRTHALGVLSPAIGAADPNRTDTLDQRGFGGSSCGFGGSGRLDIGAYEYGGFFPTSVDCDFDNDGDCDLDDIDALTMAVVTGTNPPDFDIDCDGMVNTDDIAEWLIIAGARPEHAAATGGNPFYRGDFNLDGFVNGTDFVTWNTNKFPSPPTADIHDRWSNGDSNGDGTVDGLDFIIWNANKFCDAAVLGGPQCNAGPPPNIVDGDSVSAVNTLPGSNGQPAGKRQLRENMEMRGLDRVSVRMQSEPLPTPPANAVASSPRVEIPRVHNGAQSTENVETERVARIQVPLLAWREHVTDLAMRETALDQLVDFVEREFNHQLSQHPG